MVVSHDCIVKLEGLLDRYEFGQRNILRHVHVYNSIIVVFLGVLVVDPDRHESVNGTLAEMFVDYLVSDETQAVIRDYRVNGEPLFFPRQGMKARGG